MKRKPLFMRPNMQLGKRRRAEYGLKDILIGVVVLVIFLISFPYIKAFLGSYLPEPTPVEEEVTEDFASVVKFSSFLMLADGVASPSTGLMWLNDPTAAGEPIAGSTSSEVITFNGKFRHNDEYIMKVTYTNSYDAVYTGKIDLSTLDTSSIAIQENIYAWDHSDGTDTSLNMWYSSVDLDATTDGAAWAVAASTKYSGIVIQFDGTTMSDERFGNDFWDPDAKQYTYKTWMVVQNNNTAATVEFANLDMWKHWTEGTTEYWAAIVDPDMYIINDADLDDDGYVDFKINIELGATEVNKFTIDFYDNVSLHDAENNNFGSADEEEFIYTD